MAEQKVTIKDVAREAGVSISTVSNALNGVEVLRPETKRHILEVAERKGNWAFSHIHQGHVL